MFRRQIKRLLGLNLQDNETGEQLIERPLTDAEQAFVSKVGFPQLDATSDNDTLKEFADVLWGLCLWEHQRAGSLDTKAAALAGLSGLAAAVVSASSIPTSTSQPPDTSVVTAQCVSIILFIGAVLLSLNAQRIVRFGGFIDRDLFDALQAYKHPVGTPPFSDADPYRCFLREISLQRWLTYRSHCDTNDKKYRRLGVAQASAALAVGSLLGAIVLVLA